MKIYIITALALALCALSGCATRAYNINKMADAKACTYYDVSYSEGSIMDQAGIKMQCVEGKWVKE